MIIVKLFRWYCFPKTTTSRIPQVFEPLANRQSVLAITVKPPTKANKDIIVEYDVGDKEKKRFTIAKGEYFVDV